MPSSVSVSYFAILREERGLEQETLSTSAETVGQLWESLRESHKFTLSRDLLRASVNEELVSWNHKIEEGDHVVFIPPVGGG